MTTLYGKVRKTFVQHRVVILSMFLLIALAFSLRFTKLLLGYPFADDHARDVRIVMEHLRESRPFVLGPKASVGEIYVQPLYYYLLSVPLWLSGGDPFAASLLVVMLDSLTPIMLLLAGYYLFSFQAGMIAGLLYAVSPFTIMYGSYAWSPNLVALSTISSLFFLMRYLYKGHSGSAILATVFATAALHMHFQGLVVLGVVGAVAGYAVILRRMDPRPWVLSGLVFALSFTPILFNLDEGMGNLRSIYTYFTKEQAGYFQTTRTVEFLWNNVPRSVEVSLGFTSDGYMIGRGLLLIGLVGLLVVGTISWKKSWKTKGLTWIPAEWFVLLVYAISIVGLRVYKGDKLDYYLLFMVHLPFLLLGFLWQASGLIKARIAMLVVLVLLFFQMGLKHPYASFVGYSINEVQQNQDASVIASALSSAFEQYPEARLGPVLYEFYREPVEYLAQWKFGVNLDDWRAADSYLLVCSPEQCCLELRCLPGCNSEALYEHLSDQEKLVSPRSSLRMSRLGRSIEVVSYEVIN